MRLQATQMTASIFLFAYKTNHSSTTASAFDNLPKLLQLNYQVISSQSIGWQVFTSCFNTFEPVTADLCYYEFLDSKNFTHNMKKLTEEAGYNNIITYLVFQKILKYCFELRIGVPDKKNDAWTQVLFTESIGTFAVSLEYDTSDGTLIKKNIYDI